jgi:hypothetical protein
MTLEDQINILVYFHLEEHHSGRHLLQVLKENHFARQYIAPEKGISKSSFFEDISSRGLEQMLELFEKLYAKAASQLPKGHSELGDLTIIDGSLIDSVLSMYWADYRDGAKKAKVHIGFDLNRGIPKKIFLTDGLIFLFDKTLLSLEVSIGKPHLYVKAILTTEREKTVLSSIVCN